MIEWHKVDHRANTTWQLMVNGAYRGIVERTNGHWFVRSMQLGVFDRRVDTLEEGKAVLEAVAALNHA